MKLLTPGIKAALRVFINKMKLITPGTKVFAKLFSKSGGIKAEGLKNEVKKNDACIHGISNGSEPYSTER